jgi:hypothetical protein
MRARTWFGFGLAALLALSPATFARQAQQPPPPAEKEKPKPPAKKAKRVWTDEDVKGLRKPSDEYAEKKAAAEQQDAKEKEKAAEQKDPAVKEAKPAEQETADESTYIAPTTVEEAEKRISEKREEIKFAEDAVQQLRSDYFNEKNEQIREDLKARLAKMEKNVEEAYAELALLEQSLKELKAKGSASQPESPQRS